MWILFLFYDTPTLRETLATLIWLGTTGLKINSQKTEEDQYPAEWTASILKVLKVEAFIHARWGVELLSGSADFIILHKYSGNMKPWPIWPDPQTTVSDVQRIVIPSVKRFEVYSRRIYCAYRMRFRPNPTSKFLLEEVYDSNAHSWLRM